VTGNFIWIPDADNQSEINKELFDWFMPVSNS